MKITPLDGRIGADVDLDLGGPWTNSPADVEELRRAFRDHDLLVFRDPELAAEDQIRLMEALELVPDEWTNGDKYGFLSNQLAIAPNDGQHNAYLFHSDLMWKDAADQLHLALRDGDTGRARAHLVRRPASVLRRVCRRSFVSVSKVCPGSS